MSVHSLLCIFFWDNCFATGASADAPTRISIPPQLSISAIPGCFVSLSSILSLCPSNPAFCVTLGTALASAVPFPILIKRPHALQLTSRLQPSKGGVHFREKDIPLLGQFKTYLRSQNGVNTHFSHYQTQQLSGCSLSGEKAFTFGRRCSLSGERSFTFGRKTWPEFHLFQLLRFARLL